ncbi:MAG: DUF4339 domain-containing protein [Planctomycetes bacterium]|nr:DUF4339 domain-containing protein [Planctomycetota bacterium]
MTVEWYYKTDKGEFGPFNAQKLRDVAASGVLGPNDVVRRGDHGKWHRAGSVQNLVFPPSQSSGRHEPPQKPTVPVAAPRQREAEVRMSETKNGKNSLQTDAENLANSDTPIPEQERAEKPDSASTHDFQLVSRRKLWQVAGAVAIFALLLIAVQLNNVIGSSALIVGLLLVGCASIWLIQRTTGSLKISAIFFVLLMLAKVWQAEHRPTRYDRIPNFRYSRPPITRPSAPRFGSARAENPTATAQTATQRIIESLRPRLFQVRLVEQAAKDGTNNQQRRATGVLIANDRSRGLVLTNGFVVQPLYQADEAAAGERPAMRLEVRNCVDGAIVEHQVAALEPNMGLALLLVHRTFPNKWNASIANPKALKPRQPLFAVLAADDPTKIAPHSGTGTSSEAGVIRFSSPYLKTEVGCPLVSVSAGDISIVGILVAVDAEEQKGNRENTIQHSAAAAHHLFNSMGVASVRRNKLLNDFVILRESPGWIWSTERDVFQTRHTVFQFLDTVRWQDAKQHSPEKTSP